MKTSHTIQNIRFDKDYLLLTVDHQELKVKLSDVSTRLDTASSLLRNDYTISPSGYGIHWQQLDEDLSVHQLLKKANKVE